MLPLFLSGHKNQCLNVLCIGAHCDDIEIGCGGTILSLLENHPQVNVYWQVFCSDELRREEGIQGADVFCVKSKNLNTNILQFRDGYLPQEYKALKDQFEVLKGAFEPDVVFTHYRNDRHQDHRAISDLTWNTFRNHLILEYEIPKWDGDLGCPNTFVPLDEATAQAATIDAATGSRTVLL